MTTFTCPRCRGSGRYSYSLQHGSVCLGCQGRGVVREKPKATAPKWAVFGQHRATGAFVRLYDVQDRTKIGAIERAWNAHAGAPARVKETYSLTKPRALKWSAMRDPNAISWDEAKPITTTP